MSKLAIIGTIEVARGVREQFLPLLMAHRIRSLKDEPGTLQFEVLLPNDNGKMICCMRCTKTRPLLKPIGMGHPSLVCAKKLPT